MMRDRVDRCRGCVTVTQSRLMAAGKCPILASLTLVVAGLAAAQTAGEEFRVYTEHPRLFLQTRRLRFLERERERQSLRWRQFQALMAGKAQMPEPGFASAFYARISGEESYCREAVQWAMGPGKDLRQAALVFDWCQEGLSEPDSQALASILEKGIAAARSRPGAGPVRDRVLAAIALAGHRRETSEQELRLVVQQWWGGQIVPAIRSRGDPFAREDVLALFEILHAVRDNLNIDLRDPVQPFFRDLPASLLLGYYPAPYPAAENEYYIPASKAGGEPDPRHSAVARAGDLSLVSFDSNTQPAQFLQGWLIRDNLLMRTPFGIVYEFLWANPYQPGLSYHHAPLFFHDARLGQLYVRSSWEDDATWLGYRDGAFQRFAEGSPRLVEPRASAIPLRLGEVAVFFMAGPATLRLEGAGVEQVFVTGWRPGNPYEIKVGDEKALVETADPGGIIGLEIRPADEVSIRVRESRQ
jgi:hypothetical protein